MIGHGLGLAAALQLLLLTPPGSGIAFAQRYVQHAQTAATVVAGKAVRLQYRSGNLLIETSGVALEPGRAGDRIRIRVTDGARSVWGRIAQDGLVMVEAD